MCTSYVLPHYLRLDHKLPPECRLHVEVVVAVLIVPPKQDGSLDLLGERGHHLTGRAAGVELLLLLLVEVEVVQVVVVVLGPGAAADNHVAAFRRQDGGGGDHGGGEVAKVGGGGGGGGGRVTL